MMKKILHKSLLSQAGKITGYVAIIKSSGYDQEFIHNLRTGFKKLRSLLRWQKAGTEYLQGIKNIYLLAGEIRNIQVVQELLSKENDLRPSFQHWLATATGKIKRQWNKKEFKESANKVREQLRDLTFKAVKNKFFFSDRIEKIRKILITDPVSDILVHDIRKMLKDMYYVLTWWKKNIGNAGQLCKEMSIEKIESMCKLIGDYNDKRILLIMLTTYASQERDPDLINELNTLIDKWEFIKRDGKEKMIAILRYELMNK